MTTILLRASRVLVIPVQQVKILDWLNQKRKAAVAFLKTATMQKAGSGLNLSSQEGHQGNRLSFAAEMDLAQYRQSKSLL